MVGSLRIAVRCRTQRGERRRQRLGRPALRETAREDDVPTGRTVPCVHVRALRQQLERGWIASASRERERLVDRVEQQLGEVQRRLASIREVRAEAVLQCARQL